VSHATPLFLRSQDSLLGDHAFAANMRFIPLKSLPNPYILEFSPGPAVREKHFTKRHGRTLCVLLLPVSAALSCRGSGQEHFNQMEGDLRVAIQGPDDSCQQPRNIDPNLQRVAGCPGWSQNEDSV
jgi:hypothetical protein